MDSTVSKEEALKHFSLEPQKKTILAVGGSLGARSINEVLAEHVSELGPLNLQLIWQTGKTTAEEYIQRGKGKPYVWVSDFIQEMDKAYAAADVVVSRSGAMTIAELSVVGRASIFVPYPFAAEDHQAENALTLVRQNAALMIRDADVETKLMDTILELVKDEKKIKELEVNILKNGNTKADEIIATEILKTIKN